MRGHAWYARGGRDGGGGQGQAWPSGPRVAPGVEHAAAGAGRGAKGEEQVRGGGGKVRLGTKVKREEEEGGEIAKVDGKRI